MIAACRPLRHPHPLLVAVLSVMLAPAAGAQTPTDEMQQLVNDLHLQMEITFRNEPNEFDQRYEQLALALEAWNASPRTDEDSIAMRDWLVAALRASMPGRVAASPPIPEFGSAASARPLAATEEPPQPPAASEELPPLESQASAGPQTATEDPSATGDETTPPSAAGDEPAPSTALSQAAAFPPPLGLAPQPDAQVAETEPDADPDSEWEADLQTKPTFVEPAVESTAELEPSRGATAAADRAPEPLNEHPAAADLAWSNPFVDDPLPGGEAGRTKMFRPVLDSEPGVRVNLAELSARVRGYSQGLDFIQAELIALPEASAFRLAGLTRELESLEEQRGLIELYVAGLDSADRRSVQRMPSARGAIRLIRSRAESRRSRLGAERSDSADAEKAVLAGLDLKLDELDNRIN